MPNVFIRAEHLILFTDRTTPRVGAASFRVPLHESVFDVVIDYGAKSVVIAPIAIAVSEEVHGALQGKSENRWDGLSDTVKNEIRGLCNGLCNAARLPLELLKYHLDHVFIEESLCSPTSMEWSENGEEWTGLPIELSGTIEGRALFPLDARTREYVQQHLDNKIRPLVGARHLHMARTASHGHHKWIDATIAAELAIKEILTRKCSALRPLLQELPSPPLNKLYKPVMKHYLGAESPLANKLSEGANTRNKLVHWIDEKVEAQEAIDYVRDVEKAVFHALLLLHPNDRLFELTQTAIRNERPPSFYSVDRD